MVFDNHRLIKLLKERGALIASGKHKLVRSYDEKINKYLLEKNGKDDLQTILSAFVTFKTEEGYNEALRFIENPNFLKHD